MEAQQLRAAAKCTDPKLIAGHQSSWPMVSSIRKLRASRLPARLLLQVQRTTGAGRRPPDALDTVPGHGETGDGERRSPSAFPGGGHRLGSELANGDKVIEEVIEAAVRATLQVRFDPYSVPLSKHAVLTPSFLPPAERRVATADHASRELFCQPTLSRQLLGNGPQVFFWHLLTPEEAQATGHERQERPPPADPRAYPVAWCSATNGWSNCSVLNGGAAAGAMWPRLDRVEHTCAGTALNSGEQVAHVGIRWWPTRAVSEFSRRKQGASVRSGAYNSRYSILARG